MSRAAWIVVVALGALVAALAWQVVELRAGLLSWRTAYPRVCTVELLPDASAAMEMHVPCATTAPGRPHSTLPRA